MPQTSMPICSHQRGRGGISALEFLHPDLPALGVTYDADRKVSVIRK